jgi:hypothetical protein
MEGFGSTQLLKKVDQKFGSTFFKRWILKGG